MRTLDLSGYKDLELQGEVLYYVRNGMLFQYHITIGDFVHSMNLTYGDLTNLHFFNNSQELLMYHKAEPSMFSVLVNQNYVCNLGCSACHNGYILNSFTLEC